MEKVGEVVHFPRSLIDLGAFHVQKVACQCYILQIADVCCVSDKNRVQLKTDVSVTSLFSSNFDIYFGRV